MGIKGVIIANGYYSSVEYKKHIDSLLFEIKKRNIECKIYYNKKPISIGQKFDIDYAIMLDADVNFAKELEYSGVRLFNNANIIDIVSSKARTLHELSKIENVSFPDSIIYPYQNSLVIDNAFYKTVMLKYGSPIIIKSSNRHEIYLAKSYEDLFLIADKLGHQEIIFQQFQEKSEGKIYRIFLIGGKIVESVKITNYKTFVSVEKKGRKIEVIDLPDEYKETAITIANKFKIDYCTIDMFVDRPYVCSINLNTSFEYLFGISDIDIAALYAEYIDKELEPVRKIAEIREEKYKNAFIEAKRRRNKKLKSEPNQNKSSTKTKKK